MATPIDPVKQDILPPKTEGRIRTLLKNGTLLTQRQTKLLLQMLEQGKKVIGKDMGKISAFGQINIFLLPNNADKMTEFNQNIAKMFNFGVKFTEKTPSGTVKALEQAMVQSSNGIVSKLGEDIRTQSLDIINKGIKESKLPQDIAKDLQTALDMKKARAETIARTETMRSAHSASFAQAKRDGYTHWLVDSRAEACTECQDEYDGQVYTIDDTSSLPPLHPNCACIPVYFFDEGEATGYANNLTEYNQSQRTELEDKGITINKDGTSQNLNT
jgi:SPP1 gp7 family putative phage head morphogenesis protein